MPVFTFVVSDDYKANERLDKYVSSISGGMNRSKLKSGATEILVNGKKQKISYKIKCGDKIEINWEDSIPDAIVCENIPLDIIYEDENVCVVNKKQGMVTHPACGNWTGTLVNALLFHWGRDSIAELKDVAEEKILANRRPGIVHRLDKETSGVIITAKNRDTEEFLSSQFRGHRNIIKEYIAICFGRPKESSGVIKTQIVRDPKNRKRFKAVLDTTEGKYAESHYKCIACYGEYSLMRIRIATGRTHQIRVHMKYINCPILGDDLYFKQDKKFSKATLMLNARLLRIHIPGFSEIKEFKTPTPKRFVEVLKVLQRNYSKTILS